MHFTMQGARRAIISAVRNMIEAHSSSYMQQLLSFLNDPTFAMGMSSAKGVNSMR